MGIAEKLASAKKTNWISEGFSETEIKTMVELAKISAQIERGRIELSMMLKMGSYNYQYLWLPDGSTTALTGPIEGNHYQTVNEYLSLVYYRPVGQRYDRLGGFRICCALATASLDGSGISGI